MHWTEALTDRLKGKVKLVGATISCGAPEHVPAVPHVQSYLIAVDQIGLKVIREEVRLMPANPLLGPILVMPSEQHFKNERLKGIEWVGCLAKDPI